MCTCESENKPREGSNPPALPWRCIPSKLLSLTLARVFYALLCLSHDYSRSTKFWVKICVLFLSICSDLSLHFNFLHVEEGLRQTSRFSYLRRTHESQRTVRGNYDEVNKTCFTAYFGKSYEKAVSFYEKKSLSASGLFAAKKVLLITIIIISRRIGTDKAFTIEVEGLKIISKTKSLLDHVFKFLVHQSATRFHLVSAFGD